MLVTIATMGNLSFTTRLPERSSLQDLKSRARAATSLRSVVAHARYRQNAVRNSQPLRDRENLRGRWIASRRIFFHDGGLLYKVRWGYVGTSELLGGLR